MSKKLRFTALILTVVMLIGTIPLSLFAADEAIAATETETEEVSVLDSLTAATTGKAYTKLSFEALTEKLGEGNYAFITEGSYSGNEGQQAGFTNLKGSGATNAPGPNKQQTTLIFKDGAAQLVDSSVSINFADGSYDKETDGILLDTVKGAVTDVTYAIVPTGKVPVKDASGKNTWVASFNMMAGEAYPASSIGRFRVYQTQKKATYTLNPETGKYELTETKEIIKSARTKESFLFKFDAATENITALGTDTGCAFSTDTWTNFTAVYNYSTNEMELYVNGIKVKTQNNFLDSKWYTPVKTEPTEVNGKTTYTETYYTVDKMQIDCHYGVAAPFAGRFASYGDVRAYVAPYSAVCPNGVYVETNTDPLNGVVKIGDNYYCYQNGMLLGAKEVNYGALNLVLEAKTGRITNYYYAGDNLTSVTAEDLTSLKGVTKSAFKKGLGVNNNKSADAYRFVTDENGNYTYIYAEDGVTLQYADKDLKVIVKDADGNYAYAEGAAAATISDTENYAPLKDADGNAVTLADGTAVYVRVAAEKYNFSATNVITTVDSANGIYALAEKRYATKEEASYYASAKALMAGTTTTMGRDLQATVDTGFDKNSVQDFVIGFDIKAGPALNKMDVDNFGTNFGKLRFRKLGVTSGSGTNIDDNAFYTLRRVDGVYHIIMAGVDCGVLSEDVYTNIALAFKPNKEDGYYYADYYVNGVLVAEAQKTAHTTDYWLQSYGFYGFNNFKWSEPFMYFGNMYAYSGTSELTTKAKLMSAHKNDSFVANADGTYGIYKNGLLVNDKVTEAPASAKLDSYSVTLGDMIGLNFYVDASELAEDTAAKAVITVDGKKETVSLSDAVKTEDGLLKITAKLSSIQMDTPVTLAIIDGDGNTVTLTADEKNYEQFSYTVREYALYVKNNANTYGKEAVNAVKAMIVYGAFAERYFTSTKELSATRGVLTGIENLGYKMGSVGKVLENFTAKTDSTAVKSTDNKTAATAYYFTFTPKSADVDTTGTATDPSKVGLVSLVLDSTLKIRIALNVDAAPTSVEGGTLREIDGKYYVDIEGITAGEFNKVKTVTVDEELEIKISVLAVAKIIDSNPTVYEDDFVNLAKAIYAYYYYTDLYVKTL